MTEPAGEASPSLEAPTSGLGSSAGPAAPGPSAGASVEGVAPPGSTAPASPARRRLLDHGAIVAGWVGVGMASTMAISFLLVIPIEPIYWLLTPFAGLLIGYYANQRSATPKGAWGRILLDALYAGLLTGVTMALFLLVVKGLFFYADSGYPRFNRVDQGGAPIPPYCESGAGCVYARYLEDRPDQLRAAGVTDVGSFTALYWQQQITTAGLIVVITLGASALGGVIYGTTRPRLT